MRSLLQALGSLLDLLAPPLCPACDRATGTPFCAECGPPAPTTGELTLDGVPMIAVGPYRPPLSSAIVRFKYADRPELSRPLARLLAPLVRRLELPRACVLAPVPLHPRRLVTRGYNQAALLAQELSASSGLSCKPRLLRRQRETERQVGKSRRERLENARGAFELRQPGPSSVVLVDDVITTGSTVRACAQALAFGGVELRAIVALAHAPAPAGSRDSATSALISL